MTQCSTDCRAGLVWADTEFTADCCSFLVVFDGVPKPTDILKAVLPLLMSLECFNQGLHALFGIIACIHHRVDLQLYLPYALLERPSPILRKSHPSLERELLLALEPSWPRPNCFKSCQRCHAETPQRLLLFQVQGWALGYEARTKLGVTSCSTDLAGSNRLGVPY